MQVQGLESIARVVCRGCDLPMEYQGNNPASFALFRCKSCGSRTGLTVEAAERATEQAAMKIFTPEDTDDALYEPVALALDRHKRDVLHRALLLFHDAVQAVQGDEAMDEEAARLTRTLTDIELFYRDTDLKSRKP